MKKALLVMLLAAGCAPNKMDAAWPNIEGRPIDALFTRWGKPTTVGEERGGDGNPVYVWIHEGQVAGTSTVCRAAVMTDKNFRIRALKFDGDNRACRYFSDLA